MSRGKGEKWHCSCLSCECVVNGAIDLRKNQSFRSYFEPIPCKLCTFIRSKDELTREYRPYGLVTSSVYVPSSVKAFLDVEYICKDCLRQIAFRMKRVFRQCWGTVDERVVQLCILMLLRDSLVSESTKDFTYKSWLTKAIKKGEDYSSWKWVTPEMIDERLQRIGIQHVS